MEGLMLVLIMSMVMWFIIEKFKPMWSNLPYGKYITTAVAAIAGFGLAFGVPLGILTSAGLVGIPAVIDNIITGFALMAGSSGVAELVGKIKTPPTI